MKLLLISQLSSLFIPLASGFVAPQTCGLSKPFDSYVSFTKGAGQYGRIRSTITSLNMAADVNGVNGQDYMNRNLYDILQIRRDASKGEIKKQYFRMAKALHPDAVGRARQNGELVPNGEDANTEFIEVVAAYKILSDPLQRKRYDRALQAEAFTSDVENAASKITEKTAPYVKNLFQNVAAPFLRRTGATTAAVIYAATEDLNQGEKPDFSRTVKSVMDATKQAGKEIDRLELLEKSRQLDKRAWEELQQAAKIKEKLGQVIRSKLLLALKMPSAPFSSEDAAFVLESLNTTDSRTFIDSVLLKNTLNEEIQLLKLAESEVNRKAQLASLVEREYLQTQTSLIQSEQEEKMALDAVERYSKALQDAQNSVIKARQMRAECSKNLTAIELARKRSKEEIDRLGSSLERRREQVRHALNRKGQEFLQQPPPPPGNPVGINSYANSLSAQHSTAMTPSMNGNMAGASMGAPPSPGDFDSLKKEEKFLKEEISRVEDKAARLKSRSRKLKERSDIMKGLA